MLKIKIFGRKQNKKGRLKGNYKVNLPVPILNAMGWHTNDELSIYANPIENTITLKNLNKPPVGFLKFAVSMHHQKWLRNKAYYKEILRKNKEREFDKLSEKDKIYLFEMSNEEAAKQDIKELTLEKTHIKESIIELKNQKIDGNDVSADLMVFNKRLKELNVSIKIKKACIKKK